ncbi:MAG: DEAD/DEAH box helicase, partial [Patescibacteria group bacterium]
ISAKVVTIEEQYVPTNTFADFQISGKIKQNLKDRGYITPTPIQDQTIAVAVTGKDIIGIADTGTGKTAAFAIPMLSRLIADPRSKALIVAPTRELAQQIEQECQKIGRNAGLFGAVLIGGSSMSYQLRDLKRNPRIVIGTPGRIGDHVERGTLKLETFNMVALDEVDRMLDMGFINDVRAILNKLGENRQSFFFSATLDPKVRTLIQTFSNEPVTIMLKNAQASENVNQDVVKFSGTHEKMDKLHGILNNEEVKKVIVFDETQRNVERLAKELVARGFRADNIHGGKSQGQRQRALQRFKKNESKILVATDVAARGIDVKDITHVINYSVPQSYDDYVHRIGRAGRAGKTGHALTFVSH